MVDASQIQEHMEIVGSDGQHVGTVDKVEGDRIKLTKKDPAAGGEHHHIEMGMVQSADDKVMLNVTASQARQEQTTS